MGGEDNRKLGNSEWEKVNQRGISMKAEK